MEGGYYSDTALQCQAFHVCVRISELELTKYSFLCPNGSLFDQQYFICDFWFNVDCSQAESLYSLNDALAAEREANIGAVAADDVLGMICYHWMVPTLLCSILSTVMSNQLFKTMKIIEVFNKIIM